MSPIKLSEILRPFESKWVALDPTRTKVIASGGSPDKVANEAKNKGENQPVILFVPSFDMEYVG